MPKKPTPRKRVAAKAPTKRFSPLNPFIPAEDIGWGPARITAPQTYAKTGRNARLIGWETNAIVNACASTVAECLAAVPVQTYTRKEDGSPNVQKMSAPAWELLRRPRLGMTEYYLWVLTATQFQIYGNAFWVLERPSPGRAPIGIRLVHPEDILFVILDPESLEPAVYRWRDRYGRQHSSLATDILHFKDLTADDWLFGFPRAVSALLEMATDREASDLSRQYLVNDGGAGHVALVEPNSTARDTDDAQKRWNAKMVDRGLRGSVAFLRGIKEWKVVGFPLKDLEFPSLRAITGERICAAFRVDPRMVGASSAKGNEGGLSQAGYAEARRRLYAQTVIPMMKNFTSTLDEGYGIEWGYVFIRFDPDVLADMMETPQERVDRTTKGLGAGGITREEWRKANRYPEKMDPTDTLVGSLGRYEYPVAAEGTTAYAPGKGVIDPPADPAALPKGTAPKALPPGQAPVAGAPNAPAGSAGAAGGTGMPGGDAVVQDTALNGAQVTALLELVNQVAKDEIPVGSAAGILAAAFPTLTEEQITKILAGVPGFAPAPAPAPAPAGVQPPGVKPPAAAAAGTKPPAPVVKQIIEAPRRFLKRGMLLSPAARQRAWEIFDTRATKAETPYRQAALVLFTEERSEIVGEIEAAATAVEPRAEQRNADPILIEASKRAQKNYKPGGKYHQRWLERYKALIADTVVSGGGDLAAELGVSFALTNPRAIPAIEARATSLATKVSDYSAEVITRVLAEAQRQGMSTRDAAKLLQEALSGLESSRAERIARTETIGALNTGEHLAAEDSGIITTKEWLCMFNNSRESHMELSGTQVPLTDRFDNGLLFPGDEAGDADEVINCRCTCLYYD